MTETFNQRPKKTSSRPPIHESKKIAKIPNSTCIIARTLPEREKKIMKFKNATFLKHTQPSNPDPQPSIQESQKYQTPSAKTQYKYRQHTPYPKSTKDQTAQPPPPNRVEGELSAETRLGLLCVSSLSSVTVRKLLALFNIVSVFGIGVCIYLFRGINFTKSDPDKGQRRYSFDRKTRCANFA